MYVDNGLNAMGMAVDSMAMADSPAAQLAKPQQVAVNGPSSPSAGRWTTAHMLPQAHYPRANDARANDARANFSLDKLFVFGHGGVQPFVS
eukprot:7660349-Prorocentrum_lima.AAC.1